MAQRKQSNRKRSSKTQQSSQQITTRSENNYVVQIFGVSGDATGGYAYHSCRFIIRNGFLQPEEACASFRIDRVVLHGLDNFEPLLVLDVIPHRDSTFVWTPLPNGRGGTLVLNLKVRCDLSPERFIEIRVLLRQAAGRPTRYEAFEILNLNLSGSAQNILRRPGGGSALYELREGLQRAQRIEGHPRCAAYQVEFFETIDLKNRLNPCTTQALFLSFVPYADLFTHTESATVPQFFIIKYEVQLPDSGSTRKIKAFADVRGFTTSEFDATFDLPIDQELLGEWRISEHPARDIAPKAKPSSARVLPASKWLIHVGGIPARSVVELWRQLAQLYFDSLLTVQSGRPVSFLPQIEAVAKSDSQARVRWTMSYLLQDGIAEGNSLYAFQSQNVTNRILISGHSINYNDTRDLTLTGSLAQLRTHTDTSLTCNVKLAIRSPKEGDSDRLAGIVLFFKNAITSNLQAGAEDSVRVRMGALDLQFGTQFEVTAESFHYFQIGPYIVRRDRNPVFVHVDAAFALGNVGPGGQDDLPGEEFVPENSAGPNGAAPCHDDAATITATQETPTNQDDEVNWSIERMFRRKSPLVIPRCRPDLNNPDTCLPTIISTRLSLHVAEDVTESASQTVRLRIRNERGTISPPEESPDKVVILDRNPFLVAQVGYVPFLQQVSSSGDVIANWTNAGLEGANWQLRSGAKPFDLILPSQALGETMDKTRTLGERQLADFRLSPPGYAQLEASYFEQNYTEAPWNLRRLLGYPGQRAPGAGIKHLEFELLYGLSCDVRYPFLRLAELSALIGAIPERLSPELRWDGEDIQKAEFLHARIAWATHYRRYLARVGILEPWDTHKQESLLLNEQVICRIRTTDNHARKYFKPADLKNPIDETQNPTGLAGGVTWGFESRNIYNAVMRPGKSGEPESSSASLSDLYFSSLGAWGHSKSSFDIDRSTIYADASMGRTYSYKLERIGRIGVWWNLAKHVIVYERSVVPSRQFAGDQNRNEGRPLVRKVHEYVEILQDSRHYPDGQENLPQAEIEALKKQRGFVSDCTFPKGARYNVKSSWGTDVGDIGWKVPLWNPAARPADVYPKPDVKLGLFSNIAGSSVPTPCTIREPQNLYFYTDTRKETGSDPNQWPPVSDVDYVDLPRPRPKQDFETGSLAQLSPDDPLIAPGFAPCTFTLEPAVAPADLVASRTGKPLSSVLKSVTLVRAAQKIAHIPAIESLASVEEKLTDSFRELLMQVPTDTSAYPTDLLNRLRASVDTSFASGAFRRFQEQYREAFNHVRAKLEEVKNRIGGAEQQLITRFREQLSDVGKTIVTEYGAELQSLNGRPRDIARRTLAQYMARLQESLLLLRASPGTMAKMVHLFVEEARRLLEEAQARATEILLFLDPLPSGALTPEQMVTLKRAATALKTSIENGLLSIETAGQRRPDQSIPDPALYIGLRYLNALKTAASDKKDSLQATIFTPTTITKAAAEAAVSIFFDWDEAALSPIDELERKCEPLLNAWHENTCNCRVPEEKERLVGLFVSDPTTLPELNQTLDELRRFVADPAAGLLNEYSNVATQILEQLVGTPQAPGLLAWVTNELDQLRIKFDAIQATTIYAALNDLARVRQNLEQFRQDLLKLPQDLFDKSARNLLPSAAQTFSTASKSLRLIRAFGQPPEVPNLKFDRPALAYFYDELKDKVELTPTLARVDQASKIVGELKALGVALPTKELLERLVPPDLGKFNLSDIFPDFAGLRLTNLFRGLKLPSASTESVKVSHGLDPQSRRAWVESNIDVQITESADIFTIGPVTVRLQGARFQANVRIDAGLNEAPKRTVSGRITGDWELITAGMTLVIFKRTELRFDDSGGIKFGLSPQNVELPGILSFIAEFLKYSSGSDSGFSVALLPTGFQAMLKLPMPDLQFGVFGISNLSLGLVFTLQFSDPDFDNQFSISVSFQLGRKQAPFALTIFILGGGGYIDIRTTYVPSRQQIACRVEVGITACASLALSLGPLKGGVYVYLGVNITFLTRSSGGGAGNTGLTFGVMVLIRGEVSLLGIVTACVSLLLEAQYSSGRLIGHGHLSISIEICWCFTLEIEEDVEYEVGSGGNRNLNERNRHHPTLMPPAIEYATFANQYICMLV